MNYNFPAPPRGYETDLALIIAPYFDIDWFVHRVVEHLRPHRIRFLVDDSTRAKDIDALLAQVKKHPDAKVALGCVKGIMHLKAYYFEFANSKQPSKRKNRFAFGSANATEAAFSGNINAELIAETEPPTELVRYFQDVLNAFEKEKGTVSRQEIDSIANLQKLYMPAFQVRPPGHIPAFDAWIQRGRLAAKYNDPQSPFENSVNG